LFALRYEVLRTVLFLISILACGGSIGCCFLLVWGCFVEIWVLLGLLLPRLGLYVGGVAWQLRVSQEILTKK
jgi:hypothetical protein